jgi:hypothetical protein
MSASPRTTNARMSWKYLFLDFDGVLHPDEAYLKKGEPVLFGEGQLFMWGQVLAEMLDPYPLVLIILSTDWVRHFGFDEAAFHLIPPLRARVIGSTWVGRGWDGWKERGIAVENYVKQNAIDDRRWLALDDDDSGWSAEGRRNLILCNPRRGISDPDVQATFAEKLKVMTDDEG